MSYWGYGWNSWLTWYFIQFCLPESSGAHISSVQWPHGGVSKKSHRALIRCKLHLRNSQVWPFGLWLFRNSQYSPATDFPNFGPLRRMVDSQGSSLSRGCLDSPHLAPHLGRELPFRTCHTDVAWSFAASPAVIWLSISAGSSQDCDQWDLLEISFYTEPQSASHCGLHVFLLSGATRNLPKPLL